MIDYELLIKWKPSEKAGLKQISMVLDCDGSAKKLCTSPKFKLIFGNIGKVRAYFWNSVVERYLESELHTNFGAHQVGNAT